MDRKSAGSGFDLNEDRATPADLSRRTRLIDLGLAVAAFAAVFVLWQTRGSFDPLLYPFRLLVTFVHETGHGLSAILTGGRFINFIVTPEGAGLAQTAGGNRLIILPMGYLGAALFGALLLYITNTTRHPGRVAGIVGIYFLSCAVLFTANGLTIATIGLGVAAAIGVFAATLPPERRTIPRLLAIAAVIITGAIAYRNLGLFVGLVAGSVFLLSAAFLPRAVTLFLLNFTALITGFNAVSDVFYLFQNTNAAFGATRNDASAMAALTNLPVQLWIMVWLIAALGLMGLAAWGILRYMVDHFSIPAQQ